MIFELIVVTNWRYLKDFFSMAAILKFKMAATNMDEKNVTNGFLVFWYMYNTMKPKKMLLEQNIMQIT